MEWMRRVPRKIMGRMRRLAPVLLEQLPQRRGVGVRFGRGGRRRRGLWFEWTRMLDCRREKDN